MKYQIMSAYIGDKENLKKSGFIYEPKMDGIRALCYVNKNLKFISRNNKNLTQDYPEFDFRKNIKAKNCILDGEIVAYGKQGLPNFSLLQQGYEATYVVFDILMKDEENLVNKSLKERKEILDKIVIENNNLEKIFFTKNGEALWKKISTKKLEGVMAKDFSSKYYCGKRSKVWLKIKALNTIDCVIIGYTAEKRKISSLALALYDDSKLKYVCKVGTGFNFNFIKDFSKKLKVIEIKEPPIDESIRIKNIHWVRPKFVAEIEYLELTRNNALRAPVFLRVRYNKKPAQCTFKDQLKTF